MCSSDLKLLLDFLKEDATYGHWYPVIAVMLGKGMRVGELTGLRWCDLDMDGRSAPVAILNSNMGGKAH